MKTNTTAELLRISCLSLILVAGAGCHSGSNSSAGAGSPGSSNQAGSGSNAQPNLASSTICPWLQTLNDVKNDGTVSTELDFGATDPTNGHTDWTIQASGLCTASAHIAFSIQANQTQGIQDGDTNTGDSSTRSMVFSFLADGSATAVFSGSDSINDNFSNGDSNTNSDQLSSSGVTLTQLKITPNGHQMIITGVLVGTITRHDHDYTGPYGPQGGWTDSDTPVKMAQSFTLNLSSIDFTTNFAPNSLSIDSTGAVNEEVIRAFNYPNFYTPY